MDDEHPSMSAEHIINESRANDIIDYINIKTKSGKKQFESQIKNMSSNIDILEDRRDKIISLRSHISSNKKWWNDTFSELSVIETELEPILHSSTVEKDSYQQLLFSGYGTEILNTVPFFIMMISYYKQFIIPMFAILLPVFILIGPYIILKYFLNFTLSYDMYLNVMYKTLGFNTISITNIPQVIKLGVSLFSIIQSIIQPVINSFHIHTIDVDIIKKGNLLLNLNKITESIIENLPENLKPVNTLKFYTHFYNDVRGIFANVYTNLYPLKTMFHILGDIEVMVCLALCDELQPVKFVKKQLLIIQGGFDPFISPDKRVPYNIQFNSKQHHSLLTGPNRGGKSSVLRSLLLSVYVSQVFGLSFSKKMWIRPFNWISSGLRIEDRPGVSSLFENEINFACDILNRIKKEPNGFILFDELFHSTNPPDGERTAKLFLDKLWESKLTTSIISTHVFSLVDSCRSHVAQLCVPAIIDKENNIEFTYTLTSGVCKISSVDILLKKVGLLPNI